MKLIMAVVSSLSLILCPLIAQAGVVGTSQFLNDHPRQAQLARVERSLQQQQVAAMLQARGAAPEQIMERVAQLSDQELAVLAEQLDQLPAGAGIASTIGVVFVVLLILELVGVINIFNRI